MDVIDIGNILRHKSVKSKKKSSNFNVYYQSNLVYLYHTYYNHNIKVQYCRISTLTSLKSKTSWFDRCKFPIHMLSCWARYNWWPLRYKEQTVLANCNWPNYREFKSLNWKHNLNIIMDIVADCAKTRGNKRINMIMGTNILFLYWMKSVSRWY